MSETGQRGWRDWLDGQLATAAARLRVQLTPERRHGLDLRSVGAPVTGLDAPLVRWLRVVTDFPQWAAGPAWRGLAEANLLTGVPKPQLLDHVEWTSDGRRCRAELMTLAPDRAMSEAMTPAGAERALPAGWWERLRGALDHLAAASTTRTCLGSELLVERVRTVLGTSIDPDRLVWTTAHGDLHWANLTGGAEGWLLDWESWGRAPAGYDAALLHAVSLTDPTLADIVHDTFADQLASRSGRVSQLAAAAKLLELAAEGHHPNLVEPLRHHVHQVLTRIDQLSSR